MTDLRVLERRPGPGAPRDYAFPRFERRQLDNGLGVILAHVPGRPLLQAQLLVRGDAGGGATSEAAARGGVTVLTARAMSEGTTERDAVAFVEAAERLGASLGAGAGWDDLAVHLEVPRTRLRPAMALLAELALRPVFPEREVERLREERLNDLRQAMADPRRRADRLFSATVYDASAAYARPLGGEAATVATLDREALRSRHAAQLRPDASTLIVCGDLDGLQVMELVGEVFGSWAMDGAGPGAPDVPSAPDAAGAGPRVVVVDRPGAPQSEVRIGHVGTSRGIDDYHALMVTNALLGGLFDSRLNRLLREERGYTYGVRSEFDLRRAAGPFAVRLAVESSVTGAAIGDALAELRRVREAPVTTDELTAARDYLVGVFPLRFESSAQVAAALAGLVIHGLSDDELDRYRPTVAAVTEEAVLAAARRHIDPARAVIAVVGDAARFDAELRALGHAEVEVVRDDVTAGDAQG